MQAMCKLMGEKLIMATDLALDKHRLHVALKVSGFKTTKNTVNANLKAFIEKHKTT